MNTITLEEESSPQILVLRRMGIDTYQEPVAYMRADSPVVRSEGFASQSRVLVRSNGKRIIATLNVVSMGLLNPGEVGLSERAWAGLDASEGGPVSVSHPRSLESLAFVRSKIFGHKLSKNAMQLIINDVVAGRYRDMQIASFLTACATGELDEDEIVSLTEAMVNVGETLSWESELVVDKHCIGGLPGNRTTPLVTSIVAAHGLMMPKTSSRAITSPAGTADTMETITNVDLTLQQIRTVVEREGACIAWGGAVQLSPTDDIFIRIERALDLDSPGQMIASILSKKLSVGATHVVIDLPLGETAKVRDLHAAERLAELTESVGARVGLHVKSVITDGRQPVGRGIGPALEARDVLAVLHNSHHAPADLRQRAVLLAGIILEMSSSVAAGAGEAFAREILDDGRAWLKFRAICEAQGGFWEPPEARYQYTISAANEGVITRIDNRRIANAAKLAGAPHAPAAGILFDAPIGKLVHVGQPLFTLHSETPGELNYAMEYLEHHPDIILISEET